ncbi:MAG: secretin N-terminal domain-containing protein [Pirellulaceae bacterium]
MLFCLQHSTNWRTSVSTLVMAVVAVAFYTPLAAQVTADQPGVSASKILNYPIAEGELAGTSKLLKELYAGQPGVVISADDATGQLVVVATGQTHGQIQEYLEAQGRLTAAPAASSMPILSGGNSGDSDAVSSSQENARFQRRRDLGEGKVEIEIKLSNIEWQQLESGIIRLIGKQIPVSQAAEGTITTMTLPANTDKVGLQVYRRENSVVLRGPGTAVMSWGQVIRAMDTPTRDTKFRTSLVSLQNAKKSDVREALAPLTDIENSLAKEQVFNALKDVAAEKKLRWSGDLAGMIFQPGEQPADDVRLEENIRQLIQQRQQQMEEAEAGEDPPAPSVTIDPQVDGGLIGPVQIEFLEGMDVIVVRGHIRDVERITKIINDIERLSVETQPVIQVQELEHANSEAVAEMILELYEDLLETRYGQISITPLAKPNAILLIGREQSVQSVSELIEKLDQPVGPAKSLRVFQLSHLATATAQVQLEEFYSEPTALGTRIKVASDYRSNALIIQAGPRDMLEIEHLIHQIDVPSSESTLELQVIQLRNSLAEDLAPILQEAITGQSATGQQQAATQEAMQVRSAILSFMTVDAAGGQALRSGILTDVRVSAEGRSNAVLIRAPRESMDLIVALVKHLDSQPTAESLMKVFTIVNGDATQLSTMLQQLFQSGQQGGQAGQPGFNISTGGESSLIPLNFSVDTRTNSIIASGSATDLVVVEAILLRLDQYEAVERKGTVVRLRNARADLVAQSLQQMLQQESLLQNIDPTVVSPFQQLNREVYVVPELFSNSLIISATPRYFDQVLQIVQDLDERPPMVDLQVLIADVSLGNIQELGFEFGLQDSLLFDRSVISNGSLAPGYDFNNQPLGNSATAPNSSTVAAQGLSSFAMGRTASELGYGGLVLSAASESVSVLIRALEQQNRLEVLARPHIMTMDNQPGFIQVGERVPRIESSQLTVNGTVNTTVLENVGIILSVTPRISPDGMVVLAIQAERSLVGPENEGIPISIAANGDVIRSPKIETQTATAVVSARSGQTIVLGGLIDKRTLTISRKVPLLGDIPVLGTLFRFDTFDQSRNELLIILTPVVVRNDEDIAMLREAEMGRMSWCLADVSNIYGAHALHGLDYGMPDAEGVMEIYPDKNPAIFPETIRAGARGNDQNHRRNQVVLPNVPQNQQNSGSRRTQPQGLIPTNAQPADIGVRPISHQQSPVPHGTPQWQDEFPQGDPPPRQSLVDPQWEAPRSQPHSATQPTGQPNAWQSPNWQAPAEQPTAWQPSGGQTALEQMPVR